MGTCPHENVSSFLKERNKKCWIYDFISLALSTNMLPKAVMSFNHWSLYFDASSLSFGRFCCSVYFFMHFLLVVNCSLFFCMTTTKYQEMKLRWKCHNCRLTRPTPIKLSINLLTRAIPSKVPSCNYTSRSLSALC